jgi:gliding motility-associated-like protein
LGGLKTFTETGEFIKGVSVWQDGIPAAFYTRKMTDSTIMLISYASPASGIAKYTFTLVTDNLDIVWTNSFQTSNSGDFYSSGAFIGADVHRDAEGNYYFVGNNLGFMEPTRVSVYKMDATGNPLWLKNYELNSGGVLLTANAISTSTSLILFVAGSPRSITVRLDKKTGQLLNSFIFQHQSSGSIYHRLVKFDNDRIYYAGDNKEKFLMGTFDTLGRPIKLREIADASNLRAGDVKDGMLYATAFSSNAPVQNVLLRADSNLNLSFYNKFTPIRWGYPAGLQVSNEGNIYIAGNFFTATNTSYSSPFLSKYNSDGELGTCVFGAFTPTVKDIDPQTTTLSYSPVNRTFQTPAVVISFSPDMDGQQVDEILCSSKPECTSIDIDGEPVACHLNEDYTVSVLKNAECTLAPQWFFDSAYVRLHHTTDTTGVFRFIKTGTTWIKVKLNAGCSSYYDSIAVKAYDALAKLDLGKDTILCPNNSMTLKAGKGFSMYSWQDGSSDSLFTVNSPGTYFVEVQNACGIILRDTVIVSPHPPIPFTSLQDRVKCNSDTIHLNADDGFLNYSWSPNYNMNVVNQSKVVVNPKLDTVYTLKAEKIQGCFIYDTVYIKVNYSLPISLGKDTSFCTGDSLVLDAGAGFVNYTWNTGTNAKAITVKNKGTYTIAATGNNGCISFDTLKVISLYANPSVQLAKDSLLCFGESKILDAGIGYKQYSWSNGNTTQKIASKQTGKYFVSVIDNNGCKASDTTMITRILDLPHDFLSDDTSLCTYSKINLSPQNNYNSYQWSTSANTRVINIDKAGIYWLKVTDQYGCKGVDSIIIHPKQCMEGFYIPNAFTPNKDGKNDVFRPLIFGDVTKYHFTIYNRWGEKVYESTEPGEGWNGKYNSLEDKTSVFVWTCEYQLQNQPLKFEKGSVTLIR